MSKIENAKTYSGKELETIFFRPMLSGEDAQDLGIRVMYNMPVPTTLHFWKRSGEILQKYTTGGWSGSTSTDKLQKMIELHRVKAEMGYAAEDYYTMIYGNIARQGKMELDDLTGTDLEEAETALFKEAMAESIRATMWLGDSSLSSGLNTFDGFVTRIMKGVSSGDITSSKTFQGGLLNAARVEERLKEVWTNASASLRNLKSEGNLAFFVTSDVYNFYMDKIMSSSTEAAYLAQQNGQDQLFYLGIPVIDIRVSGYMPSGTTPASFIILTDRRNLALAVNTSDFPGTEIRMWYNPDLMENRQRAVFMAGCDYLLPELISLSYLG